jgi:hypothetical protein
MTYTEHYSLLNEMKTQFTPGVKFNNLNIGGTKIYKMTDNDRLAMMGDGWIVLCVDGVLGRDMTKPKNRSGEMIVVYKNNQQAEIL